MALVRARVAPALYGSCLCWVTRAGPTPEDPPQAATQPCCRSPHLNSFHHANNCLNVVLYYYLVVRDAFCID